MCRGKTPFSKKHDNKVPASPVKPTRPKGNNFLFKGGLMKNVAQCNRLVDLRLTLGPINCHPDMWRKLYIYIYFFFN